MLKSVPLCSQFRHWPFTCVERDESTNGGPVFYQVKINGCNSWMLLHNALSHSNLSFVRIVPNLERAPPILSMQLSGKTDVTRRVESQKVQMNGQMKISEL